MPKTKKINRSHNLLNIVTRNKGIILFVTLFTVVGGVYMIYKSWASTDLGCVTHTFSQGSSGHCVTDIQTMLNSHCDYVYYQKRLNPKLIFPSCSYLIADGKFGSLTDGQVKQYQKYAFLTVDGIVGKQTWSSLCYETRIIFVQYRQLKNAVAGNWAYVDAGCRT